MCYELASSALLQTEAGAKQLPSGSNMAPPEGYMAKAGSGPCRCRGSGFGLDSCGSLCCAASPYTDPDPSGQYYYGNNGNTAADMCYEPLPSGSNMAPPAGYVAKAGSGPCRCRGSGW